MRTSRILLPAFLLLASAAAAYGQPSRGRGFGPGSRDGGSWSNLSPGDPFPAIDVFDANGKAFNTKSLKGKYTVIVNGCLT